MDGAEYISGDLCDRKQTNQSLIYTERSLKQEHYKNHILLSFFSVFPSANQVVCYVFNMNPHLLFSKCSGIKKL